KGTGNTNNENLLLDFETTANEVGISSSTGVTNFNFTGTLELEPTTSSTTGVIYKGADRFIHDYTGSGGAAQPVGLNSFIGKNAGNFTVGDTATATHHGSYNNCIGEESGLGLRLGCFNNFIGVDSGRSTLDGDSNNFMGYKAGLGNDQGRLNCYIGTEAGRYYGGTTNNNTTSSFCTLIGGHTDTSTGSAQRETVIGYNAIGKGADTAIIGAEAANDRVYLSGGLTVNDAGADYDTNIATVAGANSLFVQGSDGYVGVGIGTPNEALSVEGIINVPKASGNGIKIDTTAGNSDWGWHDLLGVIHTRPAAGGGAAAVPDYVAYRGNI
ncbi:MAG: hypothetical protein GY718_04880, partial [Lentisphaerae bacterium]|nr:hypothetical protein [Lentisphaerota bacterium]